MYLFSFLGPHLWHMEVPRLRVEWELQLPGYATVTATWDPSHIWMPQLVAMPDLLHMDVPRLGVKSALQPTPDSQQPQIRATSTTYTTAHGNTGSLIHWVRLGIKPASSRILVGFVSAAPQQELLRSLFLFFFFFFFFCIFRAALATYRSQASCWIGAVVGPRHSHRNLGSKPCHWPTAHSNTGS